jgi:ribonuclease Z
MPQRFAPELINDPFGDPGLYVDLVFAKRALMFDLGDLAPLPPRKLLRVSEVFVTHLHMDHFIGFDQLLRVSLGREKVLGIYGPPGLIDAVEHKLKAYTWNLIAGYEGNLVLRVTELANDGALTVAHFAGRTGFARCDETKSQATDNMLLREPAFRVRATTLGHGIPTLAFALEERAHINIWRNRLEALGLVVGPWLRDFKEAVVRGASDETPIPVAWVLDRSGPRTLPLGDLKMKIMKVASGRKIAYVVDAAFTEANVAKIVALVQGADMLFIEATFLQEDSADAASRHHLTAQQAGTLARLAHVKRLATLHHSPRYRGRRDEVVREAETAFQCAGAAVE